MMSDTDKQYGHRDEGTESDFYIVHVSAMTGEGLHSKAEIAAELAYRDQRIAELEDKIYDAYELGQEDAESNAIHGYGSEPYKDKAQVLAALKESEL